LESESNVAKQNSAHAQQLGNMKQQAEEREHALEVGMPLSRATYVVLMLRKSGELGSTSRSGAAP
jgi:hypothetical protein